MLLVNWRIIDQYIEPRERALKQTTYVTYLQTVSTGFVCVMC